MEHSSILLNFLVNTTSFTFLASLAQNISWNDVIAHFQPCQNVDWNRNDCWRCTRVFEPRLCLVQCILCDVKLETTVEFEKHFQTAHLTEQENCLPLSMVVAPDVNAISPDFKTLELSITCQRGKEASKETYVNNGNDNEKEKENTFGYSKSDVSTQTCSNVTAKSISTRGRKSKKNNLKHMLQNPADNKVAVKEESFEFADEDLLLVANDSEFIVKDEKSIKIEAVEEENGRINMDGSKRKVSDSMAEFECFFRDCEETLNRKTHTGHIREKHGGSLTCSICQANLKCARMALQHQAKIHGNVMKCKYCEAEFSRYQKFQDHSRTHREGPISYVCDICGKVLSGPGALKFHKKHLHSENLEKRFKCDKCDYKTANKNSLKIHQRIHDGTFHICDICGESSKTYNCELLSNKVLSILLLNRTKTTVLSY